MTRQKLIASERAWVTFRDAEANFEASVAGEGGTIYPSVYDETRTDLTQHRIKELKSTLAQ